MGTYTLKRLLVAIPTLVGISLVVFFVIRLIPGDVVVAMIVEAGTLAGFDVERVREELGLNEPPVKQYFAWVSGLFTGDLGLSLWTRQPISSEILRTIPVSFELAVLSFSIGLLVAIPLGLISALKQNSAVDYAARLVGIAGLSIPNFWIATMVLVGLSIYFSWVPPLVYVSFFEDPVSNLGQYFLPALIMGFALSATTMRMIRSSMLEVLREDYIKTARAKGLPESMVIVRHALKNAFIPVVTILGSQIGFLIGGTVIIESIFGLPGMGRLTLDAVDHRDYPQLQANVMVIAVITLGANLVVDLSYGWFDPRIRYDQ